MPSIANSNAVTKQEIRDVAAMTVFSTLTANSIAPTIGKNGTFKTANTVATTISNFVGGYNGQRIKIIINDTNTTVDFTASSLIGNAGVDWSPSVGDVLDAVYDDTYWFCIVSVGKFIAKNIDDSSTGKLTISGTKNYMLNAITTTGTAFLASYNNSINISLASATSFIECTNAGISKATLDINGKLSLSGGVNALTTATGIVNVAASTAPSIGQALVATSATSATWQTTISWIESNNSIAYDIQPIASATGSISIGENAVSDETDAISLGTNSIAQGYGNVSIGSAAASYGDTVTLFVNNNTAIGSDSLASGDSGATAIGNSSTASGKDSLAIGGQSVAQGIESVAIGNVTSSNDYEVTIGNTTNQIKLDNTGAFNIVGTEAMYMLPIYTIATLPTPKVAGNIYVSDGAGGLPVLPLLAFSDGESWFRCDTLAVIG